MCKVGNKNETYAYCLNEYNCSYLGSYDKIDER